MNGVNIYSIVMTALMVIFGFLCSYIKTKTNLISKASDFINKAEEDYKDVSKAGSEKFNFVVAALHNALPAPMKLFFTEQVISLIVQHVFNSMQDYATKQLDKIVDKI